MFLRVVILSVGFGLPVILLFKGIYGSFLFTFSIPLIWQIGFRAKSFHSLGLSMKLILRSVMAGMLTGCFLGFLGGTLLKSFGLTGYSFADLNQLQFSWGGVKISFSLQKELGYYLLTHSNTFFGLGVYCMFLIFVIGLGEEMFWRGFIQEKISVFFPMHVAVWLTALLFTLTHFYIFTILSVRLGMYFLALIAIGGVVWGYLFKYYKNLWGVAVSHGITAFIIWKYYFFR